MPSYRYTVALYQYFKNAPEEQQGDWIDEFSAIYPEYGAQYVIKVYEGSTNRSNNYGGPTHESGVIVTYDTGWRSGKDEKFTFRRIRDSLIYKTSWDDTGYQCFLASIEYKNSNESFTPEFIVSVDDVIIPKSSESIIQSFHFSASRSWPKVTQRIKDLATVNGNAHPNHYVWDKEKQYWLVLVKDENRASYSIHYRKGTALGRVSDIIKTPVRIKALNGDTQDANEYSGACYDAAMKVLSDVRFRQNKPTSNLDKPDEGKDPDNIPNPPKDPAQWNPPPAFLTKPSSFYTTARLESPYIPNAHFGGGGSLDSQYERKQALKALEASKAAKTRLGRIYQNKDTAVAMNGGKTYEKGPKKGQLIGPVPPLWGFRFMYNPTNIKYSLSANTGIDWLLNSQDPANAFTGNTNVTFDLYLNRMADMTILHDKNNYSKGYPYTLTDEQANGILTRGTEYDLEYLFRVVNGKPTPNMALLKDQSTATADFGYVTGMPLWLEIHENMRYKASLTGLSVTHAIFTPEMVPMFSVVSLSFLRYPTFSEESSSLRSRVAEQTRIEKEASLNTGQIVGPAGR